MIKLLSPKEVMAQATAPVTAEWVLETAPVTDPGRVTAKGMVVQEIMEVTAQATARAKEMGQEVTVQATARAKEMGQEVTVQATATVNLDL
jgi:hypothetical protein